MSTKTDTEHKLIEDMKLYLASISARGLQYAYFNVAPYTVVLTNSTSNRPGTRHGDRLTVYHAGELALQVVKFKDTELFNRIHATLRIPATGIYVIHTSRLNALLGKISSLNKLTFTFSDNLELIIMPKNAKYDDKKHLVGMSITDFHIRAVLARLYEESQVIGTTSHQNKYPHYTQEMNVDAQLYGNAYITSVDAHRFIGVDGKPLFSDCYPHIQLISYDGLSAPSLKGFLKKLRKPYTLVSYFWVENEHYIRTFNFYEDDTVYVKCLRPYVILSPVHTQHRLDFKLNIFE